VVAFHDVPTNPQDEAWRDLASEFMDVLGKIRFHAARNARPSGFDYPAIEAALKAVYLDWRTAIRQVLASHEGVPQSPDDVLRDLHERKPVRGAITLEKVRSNLSTRASEGAWFRASGTPARYTTLNPDRSHANDPSPILSPRSDARSGSDGREPGAARG